MPVTGQLSEKLFAELKKRNQSVAFAESCTGGQLSGEFVKIPGVSEVFSGSVVSYSYQAKEDLLSVSGETLKAFGAVSSQVARQMAHGVRKQFKSDWALAISGIAGPSGGTVEKPVGTVVFSCIGPQTEEAVQKKFGGDRETIQKASVEFALEWLLENLKKQ